MVGSVTLALDGVSKEMAWEDFVGNLTSTKTSTMFHDLIDSAVVMQCGVLLLLMQVGIFYTGYYTYCIALLLYCFFIILYCSLYRGHA